MDNDMDVLAEEIKETEGKLLELKKSIVKDAPKGCDLHLRLVKKQSLRFVKK